MTKYGAVVTERPHAGLSFASKAEAALYDYLLLRQHAGEITGLQCQVSVYLSAAKILYKPDFSYTDVKTGEQEWAEMKGYETDTWRIKRRLWLAGYGPGRLHIFRVMRGGVSLQETVIPKLIGREEG